MTDFQMLDAIFGIDSHGDTPEERALASKRLFVRSQDQLAFDNDLATGLRLTAWQALNAFGWKKLLEVYEYDAAILRVNPEEPAQSLRMQREALGLTHQDLARHLRESESAIIDAENPDKRNGIRLLSRLAQALVLDEISLSCTPGARGDRDLAVRLKEIREPHGTKFQPKLVLKFDEAAWTIACQHRLQSWLGLASQFELPTPDNNYGDPAYPAWMHGYYLAQHTRKLLGIPEDRPIEALKDFVETQLLIPVVQMEFPETIAGGTIAVNGKRGITLNIQGDNKNVWVRRATIAHELGHLIWDPDQSLRSLAVDHYANIGVQPTHKSHFDAVEARANAFAVEFLAPQAAVLDLFQRAPDPAAGLRKVMKKFGISFTAAKYHVWNASDRSIPLDDLVVNDIEPTDGWKARETFTIDYFKPEAVPSSRRGRFAEYVFRSEQARLISADVAALWLGCTLVEYENNIEFLRALADAD